MSAIATTPERFLSQFMLDAGLLCVATGKLGNPDGWTFLTDLSKQKLPEQDVFFSPAQRKSQGNSKSDVLGTKYLWVDIDNAEMPPSLIPPTMVVWSGHGWHFYWKLSEILTDVRLIEVLNRILAYSIPTADRGCWNANRFMRVPGTTNTKPPQAAVEYRFENNTVVTEAEIRVLPLLSEKVRNRILTGNSQGYKSRSERDWAVILELLEAKATDDFIRKLFHWHAIGDKINEKGSLGDEYLDTTLKKAREHLANQPAKEEKKGRKRTEHVAGLVDADDGYYTAGDRPRRVSTFTITPRVLLDAADSTHEDAIVGDVHANGRVWPNVLFTRTAFTSVPHMFKQCSNAEWQWLGGDSDVRLLLPHLIDKLADGGTRVKASPTLGLHMVDGKALFLGDTQTLSAERLWEGPTGPLVWLPRHKEHLNINLEPNVLPEDLAMFREQLPKLNEPENIWPILGWYAAAPLRSWLLERGVRFPTLHLTGTKGSGKSSILLYTLHPIFGQYKATDYGANTTRFVALALMGGSNGIPVAFSEFRFEVVAKLQHYILLAYDTGHDPRGRADQTIVDYPLSAPFSVDGEDMITDPAIQERVIMVRLRPALVGEGTAAHDAYNLLQTRVNAVHREEAGLPRLGFAGYYIQRLLGMLDRGELQQALTVARAEMRLVFPKQLPDRVRNNYTVTNFGMKLLCSALDMEAPSANVFSESIKLLVNTETGHGRTLVDDFVEDVVNFLHDNATATNYFKWTYNVERNTVYVHAKSAHAWWLMQRKRSSRTGLELEAIRAQLKEAAYTVDPVVYEGAWLHGINLTKAVDEGLDVPNALPAVKEMRIRG